VLVAEMFRRYADDGATIADLARWLAVAGAVTRTGKHRWDRSVVWGMLRNPAYAGRAGFGKTQIVPEQPGLNRVARLQGRTTPRPARTVDRPRQEWTEIPVPAITDEDTFTRVQQRLAGNKRFATRSSKIPSLLQGLAACAACGYGYYRSHTTTTAGNKIYYYRCLQEYPDQPEPVQGAFRGNAALRTRPVPTRQNSRLWTSATSRTVIVCGVPNWAGVCAAATSDCHDA
jgi:site-specific DNA recombinase